MALYRYVDEFVFFIFPFLVSFIVVCMLNEAIMYDLSIDCVSIAQRLEWNR